MRSLDVASIIGQSLNNYNTIQEIGLESAKSVLSKGYGASKNFFSNNFNKLDNKVNDIGHKVRLAGLNQSKKISTISDPKELDAILSRAKRFDNVGNHIMDHSGKYATGIVGSGAAGGIGGGYLLNQARNSDQDNISQLSNKLGVTKSYNNIYDNAKDTASDIAGHVKEHAGKYALGAGALTALTAGGLAARKYMKSRNKK